MIVLKVCGGLGNQLFQYAAGYALAKRLNTSLVLDLDHYKRNHLRLFELGAFQINWEEYRVKNHGYPQEKGLVGFYGKLFTLIKGTPKLPKIIEKDFHYSTCLENIKDSAYIDGYWQSERYFSSYKQEIKSLFQFQKSFHTTNNSLESRLKQKKTIAIHVRRTDYTLNSNQKLFHLCSLEYYKKAIAWLKQSIEHPRFFIFSDDPSWAQSSFKWLENKEIISGHSSLEDFFLMRLASHHIIANSTFSWWAAWLCEKPDQQIVAPIKWFKVADKTTKDLIPKTWIKL